jgi:hypothetical protein
MHESWEDNFMKRNNGKINIDRKRLLYIEKDCLENQGTAAQTIAELNIHLENPFPQKLSDVSFKNLTFTVGLQMLNL